MFSKISFIIEFDSQINSEHWKHILIDCQLAKKLGLICYLIQIKTTACVSPTGI
jgi:hypothetical protein